MPYYVLTNEFSQELIDNLHIVNVGLQKLYGRFSDLMVYFYREGDVSYRSESFEISVSN